jgi:hypothetical protein
VPTRSRVTLPSGSRLAPISRTSSMLSESFALLIPNWLLHS